MADDSRLLRSPRSNLHALLKKALGDIALPETEFLEHVKTLQHADAQNKWGLKKLYCVLDLDETLVYSQRLAAGAAPRGKLISVRGEQFDMVVRPGLQHFLKMQGGKFIMTLYTMGDEEYVKAVLAVIDPSNKFFTGGICCWRAPESRSLKTLERTLCEKSMTIIVDDTPDVWHADLTNLCLVRRFQGDAGDDGLMQLSSQLQSLYGRFYAAGAAHSDAEWSLDDPLFRPPDIRSLLTGMRSTALNGCRLAFTGVLPTQTDDLSEIALCVLVTMCGGEVCASVETATHLVARQTAGWEQSGKIRQAARRKGAIFLVWDHWLLDTLCSWLRQPEAKYRVPLEALEGEEQARAAEAEAVAEAAPSKKREREAEASSARMTVAAYLREVKAKKSGGA